jgi:hypothetical protein
MVVSCLFPDDTKQQALEATPTTKDCRGDDAPSTVNANFVCDVVPWLHARPSNITMRNIHIRYVSLDQQAMDDLDCVFGHTQQHLQSLTLERLGNRETKSRYEVSAKAFAGTHLKEIHLSHVHLSERAAQQLALALPQLHRLSLTDVSGSRAWLNGFHASTTSLEMLCLKDMSLSKIEQNTLFAALVRLDDDLSTTNPNPHHRLRTMRLHGLDLDDDADEWIAQLLKHNPNLQELSLVRNNLLNISRIASVLRDENQTLQSLDLSENPIGDVGVLELAHALSKNRSLQRLNILECEIWQEGFGTLLRALAHFQVQEILVGNVGSDLSGDDDDSYEDMVLESLRTNVCTVRLFSSHPRTWTRSQTLLDWNQLGRRYWGETFMIERPLLPHVLSKKQLSSRPDRLFQFLSMLLPTSLENEQ